ncbi:MAG: metallophosphoesterase [Candidatus Cloacimonadota bacterium]|nr:metallophosphoesterase [Candidatus Cloacimonadota bacterium]
MKKTLFGIIIILYSLGAANSYISFAENNNTSWTDGPYIFNKNENFDIYYVQNDSLVNYKTVHKTFSQRDILPFSFEIYDDKYEQLDSLTAAKIFAFSDVHGQFDTMCTLLKQADIIGDDYNWKFGSGVLLVVGDIFDRGAKVNESLWLLYKLRKQAREAGGSLIFLMGNHEKMVLENDLRYVHKKYLEKTCKLIKKEYPQLYSENTIIGKWLYNLSTIVKINDILFVHAGIHPLIYRQNLTIPEINKLASKTNLPDSLQYLKHSKGPFWFRGYFEKSKYYNAIQEAQIDSTLIHFGAKKIIVGHSTQDKITPMFDNKVIAIDAGLKKGNKGAGILIDKTGLYSIDLQGSKQKLEDYYE